MEAAPAAGQWGQTADLVIQGSEGPGAGAWGHGVLSARPQPCPVAVPALSHSPPSPGFTDASTTLQGLLLRCPVMRSFLKGFSPSATRAWRAGQRVVSTRCPTSGLSRLSPNWAWRQHSGCGSRDTSSPPLPSQGYIPLLTPQNPPTATFTF